VGWGIPEPARILFKIRLNFGWFVAVDCLHRWLKQPFSEIMIHLMRPFFTSQWKRRLWSGDYTGRKDATLMEFHTVWDNCGKKVERNGNPKKAQILPLKA